MQCLKYEMTKTNKRFQAKLHVIKSNWVARGRSQEVPIWVTTGKVVRGGTLGFHLHNK